MITSIDTFYNGNYFRSRLEARWAIYFDQIGLKYEYEPEGLEFQGKYDYLPDFYLPEKKIYCEIKNKNAFWMDDCNRLQDGTEKAYRYRKISEELRKDDIPWVMFIGSPYDILFNDAHWYYNQDIQLPQDQEEWYEKTIRSIISLDYKKYAEISAKVRFEHGSSVEDAIKMVERKYEEKERRDALKDIFSHSPSKPDGYYLLKAIVRLVANNPDLVNTQYYKDFVKKSKEYCRDNLELFELWDCLYCSVDDPKGEVLSQYKDDKIERKQNDLTTNLEALEVLGRQFLDICYRSLTLEELLMRRQTMKEEGS